MGIFFAQKRVGKNGRSDITDFEEIVRLDVEYIEDWSVGLDIKILLKTVLTVFMGSGAR